MSILQVLVCRYNDHESLCLFVMFVSVRTDSSVCVKFLEMFSNVAFFSIFSVAKQTSFELLLLVGIVIEDVELWLFSLPLPAPLPVVWLRGCSQRTELGTGFELKMRLESESNWPGTRPEPEIWAPAAGAGADPHYNPSDILISTDKAMILMLIQITINSLASATIMIQYVTLIITD